MTLACPAHRFFFGQVAEQRGIAARFDGRQRRARRRAALRRSAQRLRPLRRTTSASPASLSAASRCASSAVADRRRIFSESARSSGRSAGRDVRRTSIAVPTDALARSAVASSRSSLECDADAVEPGIGPRPAQVPVERAHLRAERARDPARPCKADASSSASRRHRRECFVAPLPPAGREMFPAACATSGRPAESSTSTVPARQFARHAARQRAVRRDQCGRSRLVSPAPRAGSARRRALLRPDRRLRPATALQARWRFRSSRRVRQCRARHRWSAPDAAPRAARARARHRAPRSSPSRRRAATPMRCSNCFRPNCG